MGHTLGKYFLASAYKTVNQRYDKDNPFADIPHQKEYRKIIRWVKNHKSPMDIRTMTINRCFKNKAEAGNVLDDWIEYGLGIFVDADKKLFVPLGCQE